MQDARSEGQKCAGCSNEVGTEVCTPTSGDPPRPLGWQRLRLCYEPFTSRSKRGLPRSGAKLGSILSQPGERLLGLLSQPPQPPGGVAIHPDQGGYLWLDPEGFLKFFAPDVPVAEARVLAAVQKPIAADALFSQAAFGPPPGGRSPRGI